MAAKRKISARKILQVLVTLVLTAACVFAVMSAARIENEKKLSGIDVNIKNDQYHFIDTQRIMNMVINERHIDIKNLPVGKMDVHTMESIIVANPWVANAELYIDNTRTLHINVTQRVPVVRVFEANGNSYYLDTTLSEMPLSADYTYYTTVVTNVPELKNDSVGRSLKAQIVSLVRFIEADTFWNAQVSQVILDSANTFQLIPVLGTNKIIFGDTSDMKDKFADLFVFYKKVLNRIGWDKYQLLDLRFKGQVVASPSLPWSGPVDKVMNNMNWAKSIIGSGDNGKTTNSDVFKRKVVIQPHVPITPAARPQQKGASQKKKPMAKHALVAKQQPKKISGTKITKHKIAVPPKAKQNSNKKVVKAAGNKQQSKSVQVKVNSKKKTAKYIYKQQ